MIIFKYKNINNIYIKICKRIRDLKLDQVMTFSAIIVNCLTRGNCVSVISSLVNSESASTQNLNIRFKDEYSKVFFAAE